MCGGLRDGFGCGPEETLRELRGQIRALEPLLYTNGDVAMTLQSLLFSLVGDVEES